jgi:apolipoprotein N-acyltransferase
VLWVAIEMIQARFLSGFPWGLLGVSQYQMLPLIQITTVTGVYGIAFLLVWFSSSLLCSGACLLANPAARRTWMADLFAPVLVGAVLFSVGLNRVMHTPPAPRQVRMALIQPSIPQTMIWNEGELMTRFEQVLDWSKKALAEKPKADLLIWPEAAVPSVFLWDTNLYNGKTIRNWITGLAREEKVWMIIGADDADPLPDGKISYFNSSFLINPEGEILARYRKRRLVIFGEYVPFSRWLPFLSKMVQSEGEFTPGDKPVAFRLDALNLVTSVLICFEDVFSNVTRQSAESDTDFLVNITNNGWFGESAAQWQHAASAIFRAVENNLPLVRCANNGLTCWVDRRGGLHNVYYSDSKDVYKAGYKIVEIPVDSRETRQATFYHKFGDVFGWSCCGIAALSIFIPVINTRRRNRDVVIDERTVAP